MIHFIRETWRRLFRPLVAEFWRNVFIFILALLIALSIFNLGLINDRLGNIESRLRAMECYQVLGHYCGEKDISEMNFKLNKIRSK